MGKSWSINKQTFFQRGTETQAVSLVTLFVGIFGGFFINLLSNPFSNSTCKWAALAFTLLLITFFLIIVLVELFKKRAEWTRVNNATKHLSDQEIFEETLKVYPEFAFVNNYLRLVVLSAVLAVTSMTLLTVGNYQIAGTNKQNAEAAARQSETGRRTITQLEQQIRHQDTVILNLGQDVKTLDSLIRSTRSGKVKIQPPRLKNKAGDGAKSGRGRPLRKQDQSR